MSRQFSGRQEFYPSRSGGTLGGDRKAATALVYQEVVAGVLSTVAIQGDTGALLVLQATALGTDNIIINAALVYVSALGGGSTYIEQSTYAIDDPIDFPGNSLSVYGAGVDTFIDGDGLATGEHAFQISGRTDCSIRYLSVQTEDGGGKTCHCIFIEDGSDRFVVEHVIIVDSDDNGIHVEGTTIDTGRILNCEVLDADGVGIQVDMDGANFMYRLYIKDCDIGNCGSRGINLGPSGGNLYCIIIANIVYSCTSHGMRIVDGNHSSIQGNIFILNGEDGLEINSTDYTQVLDNTCYQNVQHGILLVDADYCTVEGNTCVENDSGDTATFDGINIGGDSTRNMLLGNMCIGNHRRGIHVGGAGTSVNSNICSENDQMGIWITATDCKINDNLCYHNGADGDNTYDGIYLLGDSDRSTVNGNTCYSDGARQRHGIQLASGANNCTVNGNLCYNNATDGIQLAAVNLDCVVTGNQCLSNGAYGINIAAATCLRNRVKDNILRLNGTAPFQDLGTDTQLATKTFQFIQGTTFISDSALAKGWEINAVDEWAIALGQLPLEVQQVVRIKIWAVALGAPIGAGGQMHLDILINAGVSGTAYTTETIGLVSFDGEEADYVNTEVVHWVIDAGDDADINDLVGGMSMEHKVIYQVGDDPDGATNATFRAVEIEYV